jgi:MFS family permease
MRIGLIGMSVAFTFLAFFENVYMFFAACVLLGFGGLINPSANAIISTYISDKKQGLAQGAFSSVTSLSAILAQAIFEPMFILGINKYQNAGFPFYFAFVFCVIAVLCAIVFERIFF